MRYTNYFWLLITVFCLFACKKDKKELYINTTIGEAFGTTYSVKFIDSKKYNLSTYLDSIVQQINLSMSTYQLDSDISRINAGDSTVLVDTHFKNVFSAAKAIHKETNGAFDPTIGILVNAWDFGPSGGIVALDRKKIDSLLVLVGLDNVELKDNKIFKKHKNTFLDFNALAKGYAVDVFADYMNSLKLDNFLVEIGGEIRVKGRNVLRNKSWTIGVEDPNFDYTQSYSKVIPLSNQAMATSGSYRKFKLDSDGNRYAHIINAETGYPLKSNLLSVSVIADTCMEADAYATAFMSMGLYRSKTYLQSNKKIKAFFIYESTNGLLKTLSVNNFPES
ncbi:FAD:protein FMN transferase [Aquimarina sp. W85]|uniref:FAD:protein FMN transferase n=1 Tax=Aquimarina rhodophyticola TaxID=3342246 RepID=UPI0036727CC8